MTLVAGKVGNLLLAWLCGGGVLATTGCALGGGAGTSGPGPNMQYSGAPELAGTISVPATAASGRVTFVTALVLQAFQWPLASVDTARGMLVSDWQYFEPAIRRSGGQRICQNAMALRFTVQAMSPQWLRIAAEAYLPRPGTGETGWSNALEPQVDTERRDALDQARAALASLRKLLVATDAAQEREVRALKDFGHQLDDGSYRRCQGRG